MKKWQTYLVLGILIASVSLNLWGFSLLVKPSYSVIGPELRITGMMAGSGRANGTTFEEVYQYDITLHNGNKDDIYITHIDPIINSKLSDRLLTDDNKVIVEETLASETAVVISGEFSYNAKDISKEEMISWNPIVEGIKIYSEKTLSLEWHDDGKD